jgi:hypothetical protein
MADVRHALMDADKSAKLKPQIAIRRKAGPDRSFPDVIYSAAPHERSSANTARTGFHHHSAYNRAAAPPGPIAGAGLPLRAAIGGLANVAFA